MIWMYFCVEQWSSIRNSVQFSRRIAGSNLSEFNDSYPWPCTDFPLAIEDSLAGRGRKGDAQERGRSATDRDSGHEWTLAFWAILCNLRDSCIPLYPVGFFSAQEKKCQLDAETFQGPAKAFAARKRGSSSRDSESPGLADSDFCERLSFFGYLGVTGALMLERLYDDSDAPFYDRVW